MQFITSIDQLDPAKPYSYADYLLWRFQERVELLRGFLLKMAAPSRRHQRISRDLTLLFGNQFLAKPCEFYSAPFDVRLPTPAHRRKSDKDIYTVVQPDLCVICDRTKLDDRGCIGAPDLVVEILSPGNSQTEMRLKYEIYEESGVKEYWVIDPEQRVAHRFYRNGHKKFIGSRPLFDDETLTSYIFPQLSVSLAQLFVED